MNDLQLALAKDRIDRRIEAAERRHRIAVLRDSRPRRAVLRRG